MCVLYVCRACVRMCRALSGALAGKQPIRPPHRQAPHTACTPPLPTHTPCQALPGSPPLSWSEPEELQDLFSLYVAREATPAKRADVAAVLGIASADADKLSALVASGGFKLEDDVAEEASIF